jgi:hypothetical protein
MGKAGIAACDPYMMFKTAAELAAGAAGAMKGVDPKALLSKLPANMQAMAGKIDMKAVNYHQMRGHP